MNFLFREKDLAGTVGIERISPSTANLNEYCNFLIIQKAKPSAGRWHGSNKVR